MQNLLHKIECSCLLYFVNEAQIALEKETEEQFKMRLRRTEMENYDLEKELILISVCYGRIVLLFVANIILITYRLIKFANFA